MPNQEPTQGEDSLTPEEYGVAGGTFELAVTNHGDGDSFSWTSKADESDAWHGYSYTIKRAERGYAVDDGTPISSWHLEVIDRDGRSTSFLVDCPNLESWEERDGAHLPPSDLDEIWNAVLDLNREQRRLNRPLENLIYPLGHTGAFGLLTINHEPGPSDEAF